MALTCVIEMHTPRLLANSAKAMTLMTHRAGAGTVRRLSDIVVHYFVAAQAYVVITNLKLKYDSNENTVNLFTPGNDIRHLQNSNFWHMFLHTKARLEDRNCRELACCK
jgi:hypothetical protein